MPRRIKNGQQRSAADRGNFIFFLCPLDGVRFTRLNRSFFRCVRTPDVLAVMKQAADLDDRRIFDRILEVCVPIRFGGENFRKGNASANIKKAAEMLKG